MEQTVNWNELHENLKANVERVGFHYVSDRPMSTHPADWFLRFVSGYRQQGNRTEYASWVFNATLDGGKGGLGEGHYTTDRREAFDYYLNRK